MCLAVRNLAARPELLVDECARDVVLTNHVVVRVALELARFGQTVTRALHLAVRETQRFRDARVCEVLYSYYRIKYKNHY